MIKDIIKYALFGLVIVSGLVIYEEFKVARETESPSAESSSENAGAQQETEGEQTSGFTFGTDSGYFIIDGERVEPIDLLASDPLDLAGTEDIEFYGYIGYDVIEQDRSRVRSGFRFDTTLDPGDPKESYVNSNTKLDIDAIFAGTPVTQGGDEDMWREERAEAFKFLNTASEYSAAVKVTGDLSSYSNSMNLFFRAKQFEILQMKP